MPLKNTLLRILAAQPADYWHLLQHSGAHYAAFLKELKALLAENLIQHADFLYSLTPKGEELATHTHLTAPLLTAEAFNQLKEIAASRPTRKDELDQALAPLSVILNRLSIFHKNGDLHGSTIVVLGDDDCMGAALALTKMPAEVIVLEYDPEICAHYAQFQVPGLTIQEHDLCQPLPDDLQGRCTLFFTDPCPTLEMLKICLSRGLESLSGAGCAGYTAMSQTEASPKKWHAVQQLLLEAGCVITELTQKVNTYALEGEWLKEEGWNLVKEAPFPPPTPEKHWYCSALMRLETVREPCAFVEGAVEWDPTLYKDSEVILTDRDLLLR